MTPDPYTNSGRLTDPRSWNRYAYTRGDPVNRYDPGGADDCNPGDTLPCTVTVPGQGDDAPDGPSDADAPPPGLDGGATNLPGLLYFGGPKPAPSSGLGALLRQSLARVDTELTNQCAKAIGAKSAAAAQNQLGNISIGFSNQGTLNVTTDSAGNVVGVDTSQSLAQYSSGLFGFFKSILLNDQVNWANPNQTTAINQNGQSVADPLLNAEAFQLGISSMTAAQFMDLIVLHELAHSFGQNHPSGNSASYDQNIWNNCLK
jgi:hypothetical protein